MTDQSTNPEISEVLGISEGPDTSEDVPTLTVQEAEKELANLIECIEVDQKVLDERTPDVLHRADFLKERVNLYFPNVEKAAEYGMMDIVKEQIDNFWEAYYAVHEGGTAFTTIGYTAAGSSNSNTANANVSDTNSEEKEEKDDHTFPFDVPVDEKKVKKLGLKGVKLPIRKQVVDRIAYLADQIEGLHENLNKESHKDVAMVHFHEYWSEVLKIATEASDQSTDTQVREFRTMREAGLLTAIEKGVRGLSDHTMGLCNDEIALWLKEFCAQKKRFDYI